MKGIHQKYQTKPVKSSLGELKSCHCTFEIEGTLNLCVDKLNRVIVPSRILKTLEHV